MRQRFINTLLDAVADRDDVMILSGDAGLGVFDTLQKERPEVFLNMGVAEQNMASFGAGLALAGFKVVLYNIAPFVLYRCYEQIRNDIAYMELPVVMVGTGCGLTYAPSGMTHYAVEDIGVARTIPGLTVLSPCDPIEAGAAARYALQAQGPVYVRIAKTGEPELHAVADVDITRPLIVRQGEDAAIVSYGPVVGEALEAANLLAEQGVHVRVVSVPMVHPLDTDALATALRGVAHAVVVEEHFANCGLGASSLMLKGQGALPCAVHVRGIASDSFIHHICTTKTMRARFGIDGASVAAAVQDALRQGRPQ